MKKSYKKNSNVPGKGGRLTPVGVEGSLEEPRHIVLQHGQRHVELLQHPYHGVMLLHVLLGLPHGRLGVKTSAQRERMVGG